MAQAGLLRGSKHSQVVHEFGKSLQGFRVLAQVQDELLAGTSPLPAC